MLRSDLYHLEIISTGVFEWVLHGRAEKWKKERMIFCGGSTNGRW